MLKLFDLKLNLYAFFVISYSIKKIYYTNNTIFNE